ncbi:hypothetical protein AB0M05_35330 [Streptomyces violaceusniger]
MAAATKSTHIETETAEAVRWRDRLRELAARPLNGGTAGAVIA